ncbi:MAG: ABC transporter substrate-binding protein [Nocardioides sp.]
MANMRKRVALVAAVAAASASLAACGGSSSSTGAGNNGSSGESNKGGTVTFLMRTGPEHLDPQRMYIGRDLANMGRLVYRSLVAFPTSTDPDVANVPQPDLATDTGTANSDSTQWKFTLKDGVTWQDGKPITCEDLKYGVSRSFATDVITGGPNYILGYLDVPQGSDGLPAYKGPYVKDAAGQAAFDKAVTCDGNTITYNFKKPWPDFPLAIASLRAFDPYRQDKDQGDKSNFQVFSNGPYMLQGKFDSDTSGTFVRNPKWDSSTDTIRKALPDEFKFEVGVEPETQYDRLIADSGDDQNAVTASSAPPSYYSQITGAIADRAVNINSPFADYLLPNFNRITNPAIRQALAVSTDKAGYSIALGGDKASKPSSSIVAPSVPGYQPNPEFTAPPEGDPAAAKKILTDAGVKMPVKLKFTYPGGTPTAEKAFAVLKAGWDKAGFDIQLDSLTDTYYSVIQSPSSDSDIMWGGWGADWPSISTVIPPLFDSRINLTSNSNGQDYGNYKSDAVNSAIDAAGKMTDLAQQAKAYADIDAQLGKDVAYIPLDLTQFYYMRGSNIDNYVNSVSTSGYPDLAVISLKNP